MACKETSKKKKECVSGTISSVCVGPKKKKYVCGPCKKKDDQGHVKKAKKCVCGPCKKEGKKKVDLFSFYATNLKPLSVGAGAGGAHMGGLLRGGAHVKCGWVWAKKKKSVCAGRVKKRACAGLVKKEKKSACAGHVKNKRGEMHTSHL
jgi:hypothetical protein